MRWAESQRAARLVRRVHGGTLRAVDLFRKPLELGGVDYPRFRAILSAKLLTDLRPRRGSDGGYGLVAAGIAATMLFELMFGFMLAALLLMEPPVLEFTALVQGVLMAMIAFPLLMDFDAVLVGSDDELVLEGQPVDERTRLAVRLTHVFLYVGLLSLPLVVPPFVGGCFAFPHLLFAPSFALATVLAAALTVALVTGLFGIGLRLLGPKRFRSTVLGLQIGAVVVVIGGVQLAAITGGTLSLFTLLEQHPYARLLVPPLHFGGLVAVALGSRVTLDLVLAACALLLPPLALALALRALGSLGLREVARKPAGSLRARKSYGRWWTRPGPERAGYAFTKRMMLRERGYRMGAWTATAAYLPLGLGAQWAAVADDDPQMVRLVLPIYVLMAIAPTLLFHLRFSDDHEARWVLDGLAPGERAAFKAGAAKAVLYGAVIVLLPLFAIAPLAVYGWEALPEVLLAALSVLAWNLGVSPLFLRRTPFSRKPSRAEAQGTFLGFLFVSFLLVGAALLHLGLALHPVLLGSGCLLAAGTVLALHLRLPSLQPKRG